METRTDPARGHRMLLAASAALLVAVGLHGVDHALQDRGVGALTTEVFIGGLANAVTAAHFAPHWSAFSDPYADLDLGFLSWAAAAFEVACAAVLAAVGVVVLRRRRTTGSLALT